MFLAIRSWARAFSFLLLVCATHHRPSNWRIDSAWGQISGGFSFIFSNRILPNCTDVGVIGPEALRSPHPLISKPAYIFRRFIRQKA